MKIAIYGAAGAIGRVAVPELLSRGHDVRLVGRNRAKLEAIRGGWGAVEIVTADLGDPAAARRAAQGVDAIVYAVGLPYHESAQYPPLMRTAVETARAAGVRQFLLISTVYPYGRAQTPTVAETHSREPQTRKGRNRKAQADIVLGAHDPAGLRTAVLILPDFYGPTADLSYAKEIFDAALSAKTANVIGPLDVRHEYVYVPDVAPVIADLLATPDAFGRAYNFAGAGTITTREFIAAAEHAAGKRIRALAANKTLLRMLGTFNPLMREIAEMYYLFTDPVVLDDGALRAVLPNLRKTPYDVGIPATLAALRAARESELVRG
jgi:nucleoside-diphosphate-sugar epimerase